MKEVKWVSGDVEYTALKLTRKEIFGNLRGTIQSLVGQRRRPTKVISDSDMISRFKYNHISVFRGGLLYFDCGIGIFGVELQTERRIDDGTIYVLYEELVNAVDEAPEFAGLDELP